MLLARIKQTYKFTLSLAAKSSIQTYCWHTFAQGFWENSLRRSLLLTILQEEGKLTVSDPLGFRMNGDLGTSLLLVLSEGTDILQSSFFRPISIFPELDNPRRLYGANAGC
jgi:hypothetical protein